MAEIIGGANIALTLEIPRFQLANICHFSAQSLNQPPARSIEISTTEA